MSDLAEIVTRYIELLGMWWWVAAAGATLGGLGAAVAVHLRPRGSRWAWWLPRMSLALAILVGLALASTQAGMFDDAYISFRYSRNLVEGHGLVYNHGEYVQGYTNFLWTVLIATFAWISHTSEPAVALVIGPIFFVANIGMLALLGHTLRGVRDIPYVPVAAILYALSYVPTAYATSGLEGEMASFFVLAGFTALVRPEPKGGLAGLALIAATLTRPDNAIYYAVGSLIALRRGVIKSYAPPFAIWLLWAAWAFWFYGEVLPNTFHTKSVMGWYPSQGAIYLSTFYLGSHGLVSVPLFLGWLGLKGTEADKWLKWCAAPALALFHIYLLKVGGDFMYGRFMLTTWPFILIGAERAAHLITARHATLGILTWAALGASVRGVPILPHNTIQWRLADESTVYNIIGTNPVTVEHHSDRIGRWLRDYVYMRKIDATVSIWGIGMVGYHSRLPLVDIDGLTDKKVAKKEPVPGRGRPGHEKFASNAYLLRRGVDLCGRNLDGAFAGVTQLRFVEDPRHPINRWHVFHYDRELIETIRLRVPELAIVDIDEWIATYDLSLDRRSAQDAERARHFLDRYYWRHNDLSAEQQAYKERIEAKAGFVTTP